MSAVLPEQAAVWSYPVDSLGEPNATFYPTYEWVNQHVSEEQVIMNMINSFLGRMHLASHLELLDEKKKNLVKEGVAYFNMLNDIKRKAMPYMPNGFCNFGDEFVASGLKYGNMIYLAVWNLRGKGERQVNLSAVSYTHLTLPTKA